MAGGSSEVLQEYLVKLGYTTDLISLRKFEDSLGSTGKRVFKLGGAVAGVVASVEAAAASFAYSMRKTYFASELANSSVKNMKALSFAGKQVGISGEQMGSAIKGMAQAMRLNPGLQGLVESFGVKVSGRDTSDVMTDFVKALKEMPEFVGQQYAQMFGLDPDTYHQMITHFDEIIAKREELLRLQKLSGIDIDAQKKTMLEYTEAMDKLSASFGVFTDSVLVKVAPYFKKSTSAMNEFFLDLAYGLTKGTIVKKGSLWDRVFGGGIEMPSSPGFNPESPNPPTPAPAKAPATGGVKQAPRNQRNNNPGNIEYGSFAISQGAVGSDGRFAIFPSLEAGYAAQQALLRSYSTSKGLNTVQGIVNRWAPSSENDSNRYASYVASKMGVSPGQQLNMADPKVVAELSKHMSRYEGMPESALGAADKARLGAGTPPTTVTMNNNVAINVTGQGAAETGRTVANAQSRVLGDAVRTLKGAVR